MKGTIRAFLAVELAPEVRHVLSELIDLLDRVGVKDLRLAKAEGIHLTVKFLGEVPEPQAEAIAQATAEAVGGVRAFGLELGDPGVFPNLKAARVLWVGLGGDLSSLANVHERAEDALAPLGFDRDTRPFRPHLTLGRLRERAPSTDRRRAADALYAATVASGTTINVESISLMRSTLTPGGAEYERLALMPLRGSGQ